MKLNSPSHFGIAFRITWSCVIGWLLGLNSQVGLGQVQLNEIQSVWNETKILQVVCEYSGVVSSRPPKGVDTNAALFGGELPKDIGLDQVKSRQVDGAFNYHESIGVYVRTQNSHANVMGDVAILMPRERHRETNLYNVTIEDPKSSTAYSLATTSIFMHWLDPASTLGKHFSDANRTIVRDPVTTEADGTLVTLEVFVGGTMHTAMLSQRFDWRPIFYSTSAASGKPKRLLHLDYRREGENLVLTRFEHTVFLPVSSEPVMIEDMRIDHAHFKCTEKDIRIEIPNGSFVRELSNNSIYIVKNDGSQRPLSTEEVLSPKAAMQLAAEARGELPPK